MESWEKEDHNLKKPQFEKPEQTSSWEENQKLAVSLKSKETMVMDLGQTTQSLSEDQQFD